MKINKHLLRERLINYETISYLICGILTTVINYLVNFCCYYKLSVSTFSSNISAWVVAVIFAFFVNKIFVFRSNNWEGKTLLHEFYTFITARLLSLAFEAVFMTVTVDYIHIENWIAKIFSNVFVVIMNYFASKFIIFKDSKEVSHDTDNI